MTFQMYLLRQQINKFSRLPHYKSNFLCIDVPFARIKQKIAKFISSLTGELLILSPEANVHGCLFTIHQIWDGLDLEWKGSHLENYELEIETSNFDSFGNICLDWLDLIRFRLVQSRVWRDSRPMCFAFAFNFSFSFTFMRSQGLVGNHSSIQPRKMYCKKLDKNG